MSVKVCNGRYSYCCSINIGETYPGSIVEKKVHDCHLQFNEANPPFVRVTSTHSNQFIPRLVDIWTADGGMYQARFDNDWVESESAVQKALVFTHPSFAKVTMPQVQCPSNLAHDTCPKNRLQVAGFLGKHNFHCDFPCNGVASIDPHSIAKGVRCFPTETQQDKLDYCCLDGQRGDIRGCRDSNYRTAQRGINDHHDSLNSNSQTRPLPRIPDAPFQSPNNPQSESNIDYDLPYNAAPQRVYTRPETSTQPIIGNFIDENINAVYNQVPRQY